MGFFGKKDKKVKEQEQQKQEEQKQDFKQDLSQEESNVGIFPMHFLFEEYCEVAPLERTKEVLQKHLGDVEIFMHGEKGLGFRVDRYNANFQEGSLPPQILLTQCCTSENESIDAMTRSQMWDCPNREEVLEKCKFKIIFMDVFGRAMDYKQRSEMLMDFLEAFIELYPSCKAVYFQSSGKLFTRDKIENHTIPRKDRIIYFGVNVRFFNIGGTDEQLVDTLGMSTFYLPDIQYHFKNMDVNWVIGHAYDMATYIFENECPIESGHTIGGIKDGIMSPDVMWLCQFEDAIVQPLRQVIDVNMGEYAGGGR